MTNTLGFKTGAALVVGALHFVLPAQAAKYQEKVIYSLPSTAGLLGMGASIVLDKDGRIYGTDAYGGEYGKGFIFRLTEGSDHAWTMERVYSFGAEREQLLSVSGLAVAPSGDMFYGRAFEGGKYGGGAVFLVNARKPDNVEVKVVYNLPEWVSKSVAFAPPDLSPVVDKKGDIFVPVQPTIAPQFPTQEDKRQAEHEGVISWAGYESKTQVYGGTIIKIWQDANGLYHGRDIIDLVPDEKGEFPYYLTGGFAIKENSLFGATAFVLNINNPNQDTPNGEVFKLDLSGDHNKIRTIHKFICPSDKDGNFTENNHGCIPYSGLTFGPQGELIGTTYLGGNSVLDDFYRLGKGVVYGLYETPAGWHYKVIHNFKEGGGENPVGQPIFDKKNNRILGTTGNNTFYVDGTNIGYGTAFELRYSDKGSLPVYKFGSLHNFNCCSDPPDGTHPQGPVVIDPKSGRIFMATELGGESQSGAIVEVRPLSGDRGDRNERPAPR